MDLDVSETRLKVAAEGLPLLTIDLVKENAKDGLVIVTCASWLYYDFVLNWVGHLKKIGVTNFLIGGPSPMRNRMHHASSRHSWIRHIMHWSLRMACRATHVATLGASAHGGSEKGHSLYCFQTSSRGITICSLKTCRPRDGCEPGAHN